MINLPLEIEDASMFVDVVHSNRLFKVKIGGSNEKYNTINGKVIIFREGEEDGDVKIGWIPEELEGEGNNILQSLEDNTYNKELFYSTSKNSGEYQALNKDQYCIKLNLVEAKKIGLAKMAFVLNPSMYIQLKDNSAVQFNFPNWDLAKQASKDIKQIYEEAKKELKKKNKNK